MTETSSPNQQMATSHESASKSAKTSGKASVTKTQAEDWQAMIRQSIGTGITMLGELLIQAGKDLTQSKTTAVSKKRRTQTATQH